MCDRVNLADFGHANIKMSYRNWMQSIVAAITSLFV